MMNDNDLSEIITPVSDLLQYPRSLSPKTPRDVLEWIEESINFSYIDLLNGESIMYRFHEVKNIVDLADVIEALTNAGYRVFPDSGGDFVTITLSIPPGLLETSK